MSVGEETPLFNSIIPPTNVSLGPINDTNSTINTDPVNQPHPQHQTPSQHQDNSGITEPQ